jgi:hypothetical protein
MIECTTIKAYTPRVVVAAASKAFFFYIFLE